MPSATRPRCEGNYRNLESGLSSGDDNDDEDDADEDDDGDRVPGCEKIRWINKKNPRDRRMHAYTECTGRFPEISRDRAENLVACATSS